MNIKNFRFKKIGIYINNLIFIILKNINQDKSERYIKKINSIMQSVNLTNIESKLEKINNIYNKFQYDPFLCKAVAGEEIDRAKNPEDG